MQIYIYTHVYDHQQTLSPKKLNHQQILSAKKINDAVLLLNT